MFFASFSVLTVCFCNILEIENWQKSLAYNISEIESKVKEDKGSVIGKECVCDEGKLLLLLFSKSKQQSKARAVAHQFLESAPYSVRDGTAVIIAAAGVVVVVAAAASVD